MTTHAAEPFFIAGGDFTDARGILRFVNEFDLEPVRRFYTICHPDPAVIRAWQGHRIETKFFFALKGTFRINWVKVDDWEHPSPGLPVAGRTLTASEPGVLVVPPGYANGIKAMEADSTLLVFSDLSTEESGKDNYRFETGLWRIG